MLVGVMSEIVGHRCGLVRAIGRDGRPEKLGGQQEQEGNKQPATHAESLMRKCEALPAVGHHR